MNAAQAEPARASASASTPRSNTARMRIRVTSPPLLACDPESSQKSGRRAPRQGDVSRSFCAQLPFLTRLSSRRGRATRRSARGEEERVRRPGAGAVPNSSAQRPSIDELVARWLAAASPLARVRPVRARAAVRVDPAVAEVADEQVAAEAAEVGRAPARAPRARSAGRAAPRGRARLPGRVERVDEAAARGRRPRPRRSASCLAYVTKIVPADRLDRRTARSRPAGPGR